MHSPVSSSVAAARSPGTPHGHSKRGQRLRRAQISSHEGALQQRVRGSNARARTTFLPRWHGQTISGHARMLATLPLGHAGSKPGARARGSGAETDSACVVVVAAAAGSARAERRSLFAAVEFVEAFRVVRLFACVAFAGGSLIADASPCARSGTASAAESSTASHTARRPERREGIAQGYRHGKAWGSAFPLSLQVMREALGHRPNRRIAVMTTDLVCSIRAAWRRRPRTSRATRRRPTLVGFLSVAIALAGVAPAAAREGAVRLSTLRKAESGRPVRIIARLDLPTRPEGEVAGANAIASQRTAIATAQNQLVAELGTGGWTLARRFAAIPFVALKADAETLLALERSSLVVNVQEDRPIPPADLESVGVVEADLAQQAGFDGSGQTVAVLDTGVDRFHPALADAVVSEACFSSQSSCPNGGTTQLGAGSAAPCGYAPDSCTHGTHVAGIAASRDADVPGVAPGASVIAMQVFGEFSGSDDCGDGEDPCARSLASDRIAAMERVFALRDAFSIAAVNMSIGGGKYTSQAECDADHQAEKAAIDLLRSVGIAVVVSAGNEAYADALGSPGCISSAVSVGSTTKSDGISVFSNSAPFLSLLAPGTNITSTLPGGGFGVKSGTSMAAPHVTGAWAILRQKNSAATVSQVLDALQTTGVPLEDPVSLVTTPRIRILEALDALPSGGGASFVGVLENPRGGVSGVTLFSGWVCGDTVNAVHVQVDGGELLPVAFGTPRNDTQAVPECHGGIHNGFGLLFNMGLLGPGPHHVVAYANGAAFDQTDFTVSTFGVPFLQDGPSTLYLIQDFAGTSPVLQWNKGTQSFQIVGFQ